MISEENMKDIEFRIANHPFFAELDPAYLKVLAQGAEEQVFESEAIILRPGAPACSVYLIEEGKVAVEACNGCSSPSRVQTIGPGEVLGWSWLFAPFTWHLRARALERTRAIRLDGGHLLAECEADHKLGYELMKRVSQIVISRLQSVRKQVIAPEPAQAR
jgi:CRP/FNR family transcriptional regulator, cyclic AMP receptor protein